MNTMRYTVIASDQRERGNLTVVGLKDCEIASVPFASLWVSAHSLLRNDARGGLSGQ